MLAMQTYAVAKNANYKSRVDPTRLAARGLTIGDVTQVLRQENQDVSAGDFWEGKRRYVVRTLGQYESEEEVANQIIRNAEGNPIYIRDVADVSLGYKKPTGFVRRYGVSNISISISREVGSNVFDVMQGLKREQKRLNETVLKNKGLVLTQVYDETVYIDSAISLVNQNIVLGSALTVIILMPVSAYGRPNINLRTLTRRFGYRRCVGFTVVLYPNPVADLDCRFLVCSRHSRCRHGDTDQYHRNISVVKRYGSHAECHQFGRLGVCGRHVSRQRRRRAGEHLSLLPTRIKAHGNLLDAAFRKFGARFWHRR